MAVTKAAETVAARTTHKHPPHCGRDSLVDFPERRSLFIKFALAEDSTPVSDVGKPNVLFSAHVDQDKHNGYILLARLIGRMS